MQSRRRLKTQQSELDQRRLEFVFVDATNRRAFATGQCSQGSGRRIGGNAGLESKKNRTGENLSDRDERTRETRRRESRLIESAVFLGKELDRFKRGSQRGKRRISEYIGARRQTTGADRLLAQQQQYITQRKTLRAEDEELAKKQKSLQRMIDKLIRSRQALLC